LWIQSVDGETIFDRPLRIGGDIDINTNSLSILKAVETRNSGNISIETKELSVIEKLVSLTMLWQA